jgi:hypothetical protein
MDPLITSKLAAAQGLNNLYQRRFKMVSGWVGRHG